MDSKSALIIGVTALFPAVLVHQAVAEQHESACAMSTAAGAKACDTSAPQQQHIERPYELEPTPIPHMIQPVMASDPDEGAYQTPRPMLSVPLHG
jgi:nitrate reductase cytochrome c-type subunit